MNAITVEFQNSVSLPMHDSTFTENRPYLRNDLKTFKNSDWILVADVSSSDINECPS